MSKILIFGAVAATIALATTGLAQQMPSGGAHQGHHPSGQAASPPSSGPGSPTGSPAPHGSMPDGRSMMGSGMMSGGGMHCGMMQGMNRQAGMPAKGDRSVASLAYQAVTSKMHEAMDITFTGDADRDFAAAMIAHHEGAIDMARVALAFGKDPEVKKLAEQIIKAQEKEVVWMKEWLAKTKK